MAIYVKLDGIDELRGRLKKMQRGTRNGTLRQGLKPGAEAILAEAQRRAPVLTGDLRNSLVVREWKSARVDVSSPLIYAPIIEYGWAAHGIEPQPYMRPALDQNTDKTLRLFVKEMQDVMELDDDAG